MQHSNTAGCILLKFYIKPQHSDTYVFGYSRCILSKFYIKPQQIIGALIIQIVVSYRNSTSNHNESLESLNGIGLYLIEILHQTTTFCAQLLFREKLYLIEILHQTTTRRRLLRWLWCCILSKFYIKPQLLAFWKKNINSCILSKFYIKPQLRLERELARCSCILSKFYIKPQRSAAS